MLCFDSSRLCMSGVSLCDLCLCYSIIGSQFSNKYLLTLMKLDSRVYKDEKLCLRWRQCDSSQVSTGPGLAALYATAVAALAARSSGVQAASL